MTDYRLPAEWEPHAATWIGWPHNVSDWPGKFPPIPWVYGEIVRALAPGETVRILVNSAAHQAQAGRILKKVGVDLARVDFLRFPTNRGWTRDFGPVFVRTAGASPLLAIARFHFNAWAKYKDWKKDDAIPARAAKRFKRPLIDGKIVLEGGSIDVNGRGTLLTTEECLLDQHVQTRNPGMSRLDIETVFRDTLGITNTLWLGKGIAGDDTHGHVDDLCRFVKPGTVVLWREDNPKDVNYGPLAENRERLQGMHLERGASIEVVDLPMPAPLYFEGVRLPASYANFYIANAAVLVPTFNDPKDRIALGILGEDVGPPGVRKPLLRSNASRAILQHIERRPEENGPSIDRQPRALMRPETQPAELDHQPLGAAALEVSRWRRRGVVSHLSHVPPIGIDATSDPQTLGKSQPPPPSQHASDVELHSTRGRRPPAHRLGRCQSSTGDAPQRHGTAAEGGAQLVQQLAAVLVETDKRGFAHRELLGWCP